MPSRNPVGQFEPGHGFAASGGEAKEANRRASLEAHLDEHLPQLVDEESVQVWVQCVGTVAAYGWLSGSQAGAAVRAAEIFLRAREAGFDRQHLRELEAKLAELEEQLALAKRGR